MKSKFLKVIFLITTITLMGCGSTSNLTVYDYSDQAYDTTSTTLESKNYAVESFGFTESEDTTVSNDTSESTTSETTVNIDEEKLVYTCNLSIQTLEYENTLTGIKQLAQKYNAIISQEDETDSYYDWYYSDSYRGSSTRFDYICLRVPSKSYSSFLNEIGTVGTIISKSQSVENITSEYVDVATQIDSLKKQEERLLSMYDECETIEDMIAVEERLNEVQTDLSSYQTKLNAMDKDVAYSYVNISVEEVVEISKASTPVRNNTFKDRLVNTIINTKDATLKGLENLLFGIIEHYLIIAVLIVLYIIFRKKIKIFFKSKFDKKEEKKEEKEENK